MSELKRYLVTGSISSQFEVEVYASSADDRSSVKGFKKYVVIN